MLYEKVCKVMEIKALVVLILVLMEYALRVAVSWVLVTRKVSLNPCSNGICSTRYKKSFDSFEAAVES